MKESWKGSWAGLVVFVLMVSMVNTTPSGAGTAVPSMSGEWCVEGSGTVFKITNSTYANVTLTSTENVTVLMEVYPGLVSIIVEDNNNSSATTLKLSSLPMNTTFYTYQDGNLSANASSGTSGCLEWDQDLSTRHHLSIQERRSTIYIRPDGSIEPSTAPITRSGTTYRLTRDVTETIIIQASGITLDGNGKVLGSSGHLHYGLYLNGVSSVNIENFRTNTIFCHLLIFECDDISITDNQFKHVEDSLVYVQFIGVYYSDDCTIKGNLMEEAPSRRVNRGMIHGILTRGSDDLEIVDNSFVCTGDYRRWEVYCIGFEVRYSDRAVVSRNTLSIPGSLGGHGITVSHGSDQCQVAYNDLSGFTGGLEFSGCVDMQVTSNRVVACEAAIQISGNMLNCEVGYNLLIDNTKGFSAYRANTIEVHRNSIYLNDVGIYLYLPSSGYWFHHNDIVGNSDQLWGTPVSSMRWDDGYGAGNHWGDYSGSDDGTGGRAAGDGIGDTDLPHQGVDSYPLMKMVVPSGAVEALTVMVSTLNLDNGIDNSLDSKLENAKASLDALNSNNREDAVNKLEAFINAVEAQAGKSIAQADADPLIAFAEYIIDQL